MAISVSVQHNAGFLHGIVLLTQCYYHHLTFRCVQIFLQNTQFRTRVFVFQFFSVQGGNLTDVKIHSSEVKMHSADVKIQVKIRNQQIAI